MKHGQELGRFMIQENNLRILGPSRRGTGVETKALKRIVKKCPANADFGAAATHAVVQGDHLLLCGGKLRVRTSN